MYLRHKRHKRVVKGFVGELSNFYYNRIIISDFGFTSNKKVNVFNVLKHKDHAFIQNMAYIIYLYYIFNFKKIK